MHQQHDDTTQNDRPSPSFGPELDDLDRRFREVVRDRPFLAVGIAVAAGFAISRLLRRL